MIPKDPFQEKIFVSTMLDAASVLIIMFQIKYFEFLAL